MNEQKTLQALLGEGWTVEEYDERGLDGYLTGPSGERFYFDARAFGEEWGHVGQKYSVWLRLRVYHGAGEYPQIDKTRAEGETLADFAAQILELYPTWKRVHADDRERVRAILQPANDFAAEVAQFMGEGWSGGAEDSGGDRDRLSPVAFVTNGKLRVEWRPLGDGYGTNPYPPVDRITIRGAEEWNPSITVAANRPAKAIAGEIKRRLLPGYAEALQKTAVEEARHSQAVAKATATRELVEKTLRGMGARTDEHAQKDNGEQQRVSFYTNAGDVNIRGEVTCHEGGAYLKLETGGMDAAAIKTLLGAITKATDKLRSAGEAK